MQHACMHASTQNLILLWVLIFAACANVPGGNGGSTVHSVATFFTALGLTGLAMAVLF